MYWYEIFCRLDHCPTLLSNLVVFFVFKDIYERHLLQKGSNWNTNLTSKQPLIVVKLTEFCLITIIVCFSCTNSDLCKKAVSDKNT